MIVICKCSLWRGAKKSVLLIMYIYVHMSMLVQLVVLMNMLTLMQDGDMQMLMLEGSKEKGPGMLLQGGRLLSDSTFQMDTSMTWLHMVKNGSKYFQ